MATKRILVPHDGDQMSDKALLSATEMAKALGSEIVILYVIDEIKVPPTLLLGDDQTLILRAKRSITRELQLKWARFATEKIKLLSSEKIKATSEVRVGHPAEEILKFAREYKADLIVMGSRRMKGMSKLMMALGSVARRVSEKADCPVMLIH